MQEPLSETVSIGAGSGVGMVFSTVLGIDSYTVAWALIGGVAGEAMVPKKHWLLTVAQFLAVSLLSALTATVVCELFSVKSEWFRHGGAAFIAFYFYPLTQRFTLRIGDIADSFIARIFGVSKGKDNEP